MCPLGDTRWTLRVRVFDASDRKWISLWCSVPWTWPVPSIEHSRVIELLPVDDHVCYWSLVTRVSHGSMSSLSSMSTSPCSDEFDERGWQQHSMDDDSKNRQCWRSSMALTCRWRARTVNDWESIEKVDGQTVFTRVHVGVGNRKRPTRTRTPPSRPRRMERRTIVTSLDYLILFPPNNCWERKILREVSLTNKRCRKVESSYSMEIEMCRIAVEVVCESSDGFVSNVERRQTR